MVSEHESIPPLPENFSDELPPLPESFSEDTPSLPPSPAMETEKEMSLPPMDFQPEESSESKRRPWGIWIMITLFGFTVYNGISIWLAYQEKNDAVARTQQNTESASKAIENIAHNRKHTADVYTYGPEITKLRQNIDYCMKALTESDKLIKENSGNETIKRLKAEESELLSKKNELLEKKQELEANLKWHHDL